MNAGPPIIQVRNLTKAFGSFIAVKKISFDVRQGEILGFLGPNGAGKTTTIKMIMGLLSVTDGSILVKGMDTGTRMTTIKEILGYMSQKFSLYPLLTALENIEFTAGIFRFPREKLRRKLEEIKEKIPAQLLRIQVKDIPPGIRQKVALFVCLMTDPEIILLDEPTSGVDPQVRRDFWSDIYALKKAGKTILVTTHYLDEAEYADRILIINKGELILEGEPQTLKKEGRAATMEDLFKRAIDEHEKV